jgi:hypothetical protein
MAVEALPIPDAPRSPRVDHEVSDATRRRHAERLSTNIMITNADGMIHDRDGETDGSRLLCPS